MTKVGGLREEVLARMVEVNLLLSLARYVLPQNRFYSNCLSLSLLCRINKVHEKKMDISPVNEMYTVSATPKYGEKTEANIFSSEKGKVIGSLV